MGELVEASFARSAIGVNTVRSVSTPMYFAASISALRATQ